MRYEKELLELLPMLESYLKKVRAKYDGLVDMDDLYQECLLNAIQCTVKTKIRNPKNYFIGVFDKTIKAQSVKSMREFQVRNEIPIRDTWEQNEIGVIEEIDFRVRSLKPATRRVWASLKSFHGDRRCVMKHLDCYGSFLDYHKRKLRQIYEDVIAN